MYTAIQQNGTPCKLTATDNDNQVHDYPNIILYEVDGVHYCYFTRGLSPVIGFLASNSEIGITTNVYVISNGTVRQGDPEYIDSSTPSDYYSNFKIGNFTLSKRS